ncbi:hypothetical protein RRG08_031019 [Elysia crispata]|uniref:Major facilitator superfamily (MFS) profile domain-containing protein n=1 Tax=Elysia crispata TaxID=231223 RepID=A0AAE1ADF5_9GAST|nr:hypothetical protein RRG08_031019 [Elysia crispata]
MSDQNGSILSKESPSSDDYDIREEINQDSDYHKRNELPVDRGWAWAICLGGFIFSFNFGLTRHTLAVMFLEVIDMYDTTLTTGSLIFLFIVLGAGTLSSLSSNFIVPRVGEKAVTCSAGLVSAISSVGFSFAPNIEVFLVCAAVKGLCTGAAFVPSISLIRHYFHRRRSIAQILARAGDSVSSIVMPPLIRLMRNEFGVRGAFLIVAAIELHMVLGGLLLRPVESYKYKPDLPDHSKETNRKRKDKTGTKGSQNGEDIEMTEIKQNLLSPTGRIPETSTNLTTGRQQQQNDGRLESRSNPEMETKRDVATRARQRALSITSVGGPDELDVALDYREDCKENDHTDSSCCGDCGFLRLWSFHMVLLFAVFAAANMYIRDYIPVVAASQGATLDQAAMLVTVVGAMDLVSRLSLGFLADTHLLTPSQILGAAHLALGVTCQAISSFNTFPTLVVMSVLFGTFMGTRVAMLPLVCIEVVGVDKMPQAFGIVTTIGTFATSILNPVLATIAESYGGSFVPIMHILGGCFFVSSSTLLVLPLFKRMDRKRGLKPT